jgi:hypothetical protein
MKKFIFIFFALLVSTFGFAQLNPAPYGPQYVGPASKATLQPALPGAQAGANTGLSVQNGNANKVRVRQAGTSQSVYTIQDDGTGIGGNQAKVMQTGAVQAISGVENAAEVYQSGTNNRSQTKQEGDYNSAITRQGQNSPNSANNKAGIRQGTGQQAEHNVAVIDQDGEDNESSIKQTYDNSEAWTVQNGNSNQSMVVQNAGPNGTAGHYAYTEQIGIDNKNAILQSGEGQSNWAFTYQEGENNLSEQTQVQTDIVGTSFVNYAMVDQGTDKEGLISGIKTNLDGVDSRINNTALNGATTNSVALQNQNGGDLDAETHQFGNGNHSEQYQSGYGNDAYILQNSYGSGNYGRQDQSGTASTAGLAQVGSGNKAWQRQMDDDNIVTSTQIGNGNLLNTYQDGNGNRGITSQYGTDNAALLVQRGGHSYTIQQDGTGNQADILQLGPNGSFESDGIDCFFLDPNTPNIEFPDLDFNLPDICSGC